MKFNKRYINFENGIVKPAIKNGIYDIVYFGCAVLRFVENNFGKLENVKIQKEGFSVTIPTENLIFEKHSGRNKNGKVWSSTILYFVNPSDKYKTKKNDEIMSFDEFIMDFWEFSDEDISIWSDLMTIERL